MIATNIATQNDENSNPGPTILEVNSKIIPLITRLKSPKVKMVIGSENKVSNGLIKKLRNASTNAAKKATPKLET